MTQRNLDILKESYEALGTLQTLEILGISAGEISQRRARDVFHKWFTDAEKAGRIQPWRIEEGRAGTRWYRLEDIHRLRVNDALRGEIIIK